MELAEEEGGVGVGRGGGGGVLLDFVSYSWMTEGSFHKINQLRKMFICAVGFRSRTQFIISRIVILMMMMMMTTMMIIIILILIIA